MIFKRSLLLPLSVFLVAALTLLGTLLFLVPEPRGRRPRADRRAVRAHRRRTASGCRARA